MLLELRLENYAVIDNVAVEFAPGLNLLTGETGAGKSILIDALALLLGAKASTEVIRHGADRAFVSAVFSLGVREAKCVSAILDAHGLDPADDLILRREISGKGRVFINNQPATVSIKSATWNRPARLPKSVRRQCVSTSLPAAPRSRAIT